MSAGEHTSCIGVATRPEDDTQGFVAQQRWAGIEATFMALPNPLAEFETASAYSNSWLNLQSSITRHLRHVMLYSQLWG